jgi:tight adherence protein C
MTTYVIIFGVLLALLAFLYLLAGKKYTELVQEHKQDFYLPQLAPASLVVMDKTKILQHMSNLTTNAHQKLVQIYGTKNAFETTKMYFAQLISMSLLLLVVFSGLALLGGDGSLFYLGLLLAVMMPFLLYRQLDEKIKERQEHLIMEFPEFVNKMVLLVNAGETVPNAIIKCVQQKKNADKSELYKELKDVVHKLENGEPFPGVMEQFSKKCGIQEASIFTTTVLLNYRRGGNEFVTAVRKLSQDLWEKRKAVAKIRGEKASTKLVFPLVIIFFVIVVIIGWPAMQML